MALSMYQASVPVFQQHLSGLATVLDKAAAWAGARKLDPAVILSDRLYPDMFPFVRQVKAVTDHAVNTTAKLAGVEIPKLPECDGGFDQCKARVAAAQEFLSGIKPAQIDGTEDKTVTMQLGANQREFKGQPLLLTFALPNFYFHATTAYNLLRQYGVEIGKRDFLGSAPAPK
jgi:uncharacterized protein